MSIEAEISNKSATRGEGGNATHVPGEPAFWLLLLGDMFMFGFMFVVFVFYKHRCPAQSAVFHHGHSTLNIYLGVVNTMLLLGSSWCVARAVGAAKSGSPGKARLLVKAAFSCGAMFVVVKAFEYGQHFHRGYFLNTDIFDIFYYSYTGIHLVHVLIGLGVLAYVSNHVPRKSDGDRTRVAVLEGGACYWHMVDVFWIVIFSLFYLVA